MGKKTLKELKEFTDEDLKKELDKRAAGRKTNVETLLENEMGELERILNKIKLLREPLEIEVPVTIKAIWHWEYPDDIDWDIDAVYEQILDFIEHSSESAKSFRDDGLSSEEDISKLADKYSVSDSTVRDIIYDMEDGITPRNLLKISQDRRGLKESKKKSTVRRQA